MGEVYRATDTRLNRTVAIKLLPSHLAGDAERRQRLEREARIISSLDHRHICALYDVGYESGREFLVMQYVDGETLADRLKKGPLPIDTALQVAAEIAEALDAAHRQSIVHRDLKPANVMLTKAGVKVLDFGLAKLNRDDSVADGSAGAVVAAPAAATRTDSYPISEHGAVLGTLPYMAPEQIEGMPADARTDIFALGAVIFEMVTGRRAFEGPSAARTLAAIMGSDPPAVSSLQPRASASVDRLVRKCLAKDPDRRWQSARDLGDELQWIRAGGVPNAPSEATPHRPGRRMAVLTLTGLALAAAVAAAAFIGAARARVGEPPRFTRLTFQRGTISNARFGPDRQTVVYAASWEGRPSEIFMTSVGSPESRGLGLKDVDLLDVSHTGELAILRRGSVLAVSPLTGTRAPRDIADHVSAAQWGSDGSLAAIRSWDPSLSATPVEFPLGKGILNTSSAQRVQVAPDGKHLAISQTPLIALSSVLTLVSASGETRDLGTWESITGFSFSPDGHEIWLTGERSGHGPVLWAVTLDGNARVLARFPGEPVLHDVTPDGRVLITTVERRSQLIAVVDGQGHDLSWLSASSVRGITNDGRTILFEDVSDAPGAARSVWIRTVDGAPAMRLGDGRPLAIAADGKWVAATITGPPARLVLYPVGPGTTRVLAEGARDYPAASFVPDGTRLFIVETPTDRAPAAFNFKLADLTTGNVASLAPETGNIHVRHVVAPDGRAVLVKRQGGGFFVIPLAAQKWSWDRVTPVPGLDEYDYQRQWSTDGAVYVLRYERTALRIDRVQIPSGMRTLWKRIEPSDLAGVGFPGVGGFFTMTPDTRTYAYSYERTLSTLYAVDGLK